jgi:hypothetical protein
MHAKYTTGTGDPSRSCYGVQVAGARKLVENTGYNLIPAVFIKIMEHTCKRSSKSRPASFFMADALLWKRRMVPLPNVGTWRYLRSVRHRDVN